MLYRQLRRLGAALCAVAAIVGGGASAADDPASYPNKPIRIIVPFVAGGGTDMTARLLAQKLGDKFGQQVIVDNRPGGNTVIATQAVASAAPDGYTLLLANSTFAINHLISRNLPYDTFKDFTPVSGVSSGPWLMVVHPSVPANNLKELIAYAKANPGKLNFSSPGKGTSVHISGEMLNDAAGIDMVHVPFKGSGPAMTAVLGGEVQVLVENISAAVPNVKAGRLRPIAVTSITRAAPLPDVPTLNEAGLPGFEVTAWFSMFAPSATPKSIINTLNAEFVKALRDPKVQEQMLSRGLEPRPMTPDEFAAIWRKDIEKYAAIVKKAKISID